MTTAGAFRATRRLFNIALGHTKRSRRKAPVEKPPSLANFKTSECIKDSVLPYVEVEDEMFLPTTVHGKTMGELFRSNNKYSVTDLNLQYCELRTFYNNIVKEPRVTTEAMLRGIKVHKMLEESVNIPVKQIVIEKPSQEDTWAMKMISSSQRLEQLSMQGLVRELYVMGFVEGRFVTGYIDALQMVDGLVEIRDSKTRTSDTLPPESQQQSAFQQLLIYSTVMKSMGKLDMDKFATQMELDIDKPLNEALVSATEMPFHNLRRIGEYLRIEVASLRFSDKLHVEYVRSRGRGAHKRVEIVAHRDYQYDQHECDKALKHAFDYWDSKRDPVGVPREESFLKCTYCKMAPKCSWKASLDDRGYDRFAM